MKSIIYKGKIKIIKIEKFDSAQTTTNNTGERCRLSQDVFKLLPDKELMQGIERIVKVINKTKLPSAEVN